MMDGQLSPEHQEEAVSFFVDLRSGVTVLPLSMTESALRARASNRGFPLHKSRGPESIDNYGGWMIVDAYTNTVAAGEKYNLSDEEVEGFLNEKPTLARRWLLDNGYG